MNTISITYALKWQVKDAEEYCFTSCNRLVNTKRQKEIKKVMQGRCIGYNIRGKFISLTSLKTKLTKIEQTKTPF